MSFGVIYAFVGSLLPDSAPKRFKNAGYAPLIIIWTVLLLFPFASKLVDYFTRERKKTLQDEHLPDDECNYAASNSNFKAWIPKLTTSHGRILFAHNNS